MQYDKVIYKVMLLLNLNLDSHSTKCSRSGLLEMFVKLQSSYQCQNVDQNVVMNPGISMVHLYRTTVFHR